MNSRLKIDFVSDVSCPWCVIGLKALEEAVARLGDQVTTEVHLQPFELNPHMPAEGQDIAEHMMQKYGSTLEQSKGTREAIRARGEDLGFRFQMEKLGRIYNTFNAHRLLRWAATEGRELALQHALFAAYFTDGKNLGDPEVLVEAAATVGLDTVRAAEVLASDAFAKEVREQEKHYLDMGVQAVPSVIINDRHLIQGGQPVETFERALRQIAASA